jgi:glutamyl-Q tRNA(Asp) synthetase
MTRGAGRFAPSPTGPLHLGSLQAATASYLDARSHGLAWLVRFDDLDTPRNQPGAEDVILRALESHGLFWDASITRQSENVAAYEAALAELAALGLLFYCNCSRRSVAKQPAYPGTCRHRQVATAHCAVRVLVDDAVVAFTDIVKGFQQETLALTSGDFIVRRRDGIIAYQLATAVDDGSPDIGRAIRGNDLLGNTGRQIFLMSKLGLQPPRYGHIPVLVNAAGQKLSKQSHAEPLRTDQPEANLRRVLSCLGLPEDEDSTGCSPRELLERASESWSLARLPDTDTIEIS